MTGFGADEAAGRGEALMAGFAAGTAARAVDAGLDAPVADFLGVRFGAVFLAGAFAFAVLAVFDRLAGALAAFRAGARLAAGFFADFLAAAFFVACLPAAVIFNFFSFLFSFLSFFAFLVFFAMIVLPIVAAIVRCQPDTCSAVAVRTLRSTTHLPNQLGRIRSRPLVCNAGGTKPPVAQSINWTGCTTGMLVPAAIWVMQPIFPAAIKSGFSFSI
jgi:hypothetical protein